MKKWTSCPTKLSIKIIVFKSNIFQSFQNLTCEVNSVHVSGQYYIEDQSMNHLSRFWVEVLGFGWSPMRDTGSHHMRINLQILKTNKPFKVKQIRHLNFSSQF